MKGFVTLLIVSCFYSCGLFKNTRSALQESHQQLSGSKEMEIRENKDQVRTYAGITWRKDTSNLDYAIQLWPKGNFTYSPEHGFSGQAEKVLVMGSAKSSSSLSSQAGSIVKDKGTVSVQASQRFKQSADQESKKKVSSPSWKWVVGGLFLLLILTAIIYTHIKQLKII